MAIYKNVASQILAVYAYDSSDASSKTGDSASITAQISLDGAAMSATNDSEPTELDSANAPGIYLFTMTQAETNADLIVLYAKSATSGILLEPLTIYTTPGTSTAIDANAVQVEGSDATDQINTACDVAVADALLATAANLATVDTNVSLILADTGELQTDNIPGTLATISGKIDDIDGIVDHILADTGELQVDDIPGTLATISGKIDDIDDFVDTEVAAIKSDTEDILADTVVIGAAGAGLTAIPWNSAWDTDVQSGAEAALVANNLDHLLKVAVTDDDVVDNSVFAYLVSEEATAVWSSFENDNDSLEAIRNNSGGGGGGSATETNQELIIELLSSEAKF